MADQPSSRRSFLFGRSSRQEDPWLRFLARLKRSCEGTLRLHQREGAGLARLEPLRLEDVLHARTLCQEYGVCMALDGVPLPPAEQQRPVLIVAPGQAWGNATVVREGVWRVEAGCPLPVMRAMGILVAHETMQTVVPVQNLAQWLAMLDVQQADMGTLARYGVQAIECLYPDGSIEVLGPFGVQDSQPLRSLTAQRTIPALFQLTADPRLQQLLQALPAGQWPLRYRLDALMANAGTAVNLSHLLLGHRGSLAWVVAAHMQAEPIEQPEVLAVPVKPAPALSAVPEQQQACRELEQAIKRAMDPNGLYMSTAG